MKGPASRKMWLVGSQADGDGTRVFDFAIDEPMECDLHAIPGQFFMLGIPGVGEAPFSFLDMPDGAGAFRALIRRCGMLTAALFELPLGAALGYRGPCGVGWPLLMGRYKVMLIAADHGLIALMSFIEEARLFHLPLSLNLLHFCGSPPSRTLDAAKERWGAYVNILESTGEEGATLWSQEQSLLYLQRVLDHERPETMLCCAPEIFARATARLCTIHGIRPENIWLHIDYPMLCSNGLRRHCQFGTPCLCRSGPVCRYDRYQQ